MLSTEAWVAEFCRLEDTRDELFQSKATNSFYIQTMPLDERKHRAEANFNDYISAIDVATVGMGNLSSRTESEAASYILSWVDDLQSYKSSYERALPEIKRAKDSSDFDGPNYAIRSVSSKFAAKLRPALNEETRLPLRKLALDNECGAFGKEIPIAPLLPLPISMDCTYCGMRWSVTPIEIQLDTLVLQLDLETTGDQGNLDLRHAALYVQYLTAAQVSTLLAEWAPQTFLGTPYEVRFRPLFASTGYKYSLQPDQAIQKVFAPGESWSGRIVAKGKIPNNAAALVVIFDNVHPNAIVGAERVQGTPVKLYSADSFNPVLSLTGEPFQSPWPEAVNLEHAAPTQFSYGLSTSAEDRRITEDAVARAKAFASFSLGVTPQPFAVYAFDDLDELVKVQQSKRPSVSVSELKSAWGVRYPGSLTGMVWLETSEIFLRTNTGWNEGNFDTVFHEYFHVIQAELGSRQTLEPAWLQEGSAEFFSRLYYLQLPGATPESMRTRDIQGASTAGLLSSIESRTAFKSAPTNPYPLSYLATAFLLRDRSLDNVMEYYRLIGGGSPWRIAFTQAFGTEVGVFYDEFEAYRANGYR